MQYKGVVNLFQSEFASLKYDAFEPCFSFLVPLLLYSHLILGFMTFRTLLGLARQCATYDCICSCILLFLPSIREACIDMHCAERTALYYSQDISWKFHKR